MAAKLSVDVQDGKNNSVAKMSTPLTVNTFQRLQLPVEMNNKTYMVEVVIDLTGLIEDAPSS